MSSEGNPEINISEDKGQQDDDNSSVESNNEFKVPLPAKDKREIELEQEAKLKAKYGMIKKPGGGSALLQKRLQKGKYFDSGDYNMAKAKMNNPKHPLAAKEKLLLQESIGGVIPTPESVEQTRKPSITTSKLLMQEEGGEKLDFHQRRGGVHNM